MVDPSNGPPDGRSDTPIPSDDHLRLLDRLAELKASQAELAEATARIHATLDAAVDGILTIDAMGTIEAANAAALELFGYTNDELIGENVKRLMPAPYQAEHDGYLAAYRSTGEKRIIGTGREVVGLRKNGSTFPMELSVGEATTGDRQLFAGVIRDVSARKESERNLSDSLAQMSSILDGTVDSIVSIDEHGRIESFNRASERIFGYRAEEVIGENVRLLMPEPYSSEHDTYLRNFLTTGQKKIIGVGREVTGRRKDGSVFPMDLTVSEAYGNSHRMFTGISRDLTDRVEAEEAQASLAAILEDSLNEIFLFEAESLRFLQVNKGARTNLGYSMEELSELTPVDIKPELDAKEFTLLIEPLRSGERDRLHFETVHQRKDGSTYPVDVHLQLGGYRGRAAFVALIFDVTERMEAKTKLAQIEKRAHEAEKLASISTLTAGIAHDVGTPMNVILGYAQMLEQSLEDDSQRKRARIIGEQTQRVANLIQTLLNISRPHERRRSSFHLADVLDHALEFFQEKLKKHAVTVERDFGDVPEFMGDRDQLEQVFLNLIVNAADAMPSGGSLSVELSSSPPDDILIVVRDTGSGIDADALSRIFEPFYTTKKRGEGNGLGLLVSQSIVTEHGGTIEVSSETGQGTEFRIVLPASGSN